MTAEDTAKEKNRVEAIAEAARSFVRIYDEFDGDPSCCGEYLDALVMAVDTLGAD